MREIIIIIKVLLMLWISWVSSTTTGLTYMDPLNYGPYNPPIAGEDPCNPLYWYPKNIPEYCHLQSTPKPPLKPNPSLIPSIPPPAAIPIPMPMPPPPQPFPFPGPLPYPMPYIPMAQVNPIMPPLFPMPMAPPPLPYGIPLQPSSPMLPIAGMPYQSPIVPYNLQQQQIGFFPGLPGMVSGDGGINILPFSDAYADLLEKHKQKMIRRKYQKIINKYEGSPWKSSKGKF